MWPITQLFLFANNHNVMKLYYRILLLIITISFLGNRSYAQIIYGKVTNDSSVALPFTSVLVKGTQQGTTANVQGNYTLKLGKGKHTLLFKYVGYSTLSQVVEVNQDSTKLNIQLKPQTYELKEVVIKNNQEDPAYAIIRNAIKKRKEHLKMLEKIDCDVYVKGQLQLRDHPDKFFGKKVDFEDGDTSKKKMIYLSETIAHYAKDGSKIKIDVKSTRVSGDRDGYGFGGAQVVSFYENIVSLGSGLNPRGFISPISDGALQYYKFKFKGTFYENGKEINHIQVIPKRKYEPLFAGYINITEDDWKIQGIQLVIYKDQQMQLLDTLKIDQTYNFEKNNWLIKQQTVYPSGNVFGFKFFGNFIQVYNNVNMSPSFPKNYFNNTIIKVEDSANKKNVQYWDSIRPIPLLQEEARDYVKKDSFEIVKESKPYLDSIDKKANRITLNKIFISGFEQQNSFKKWDISATGLLKTIHSFNTVEGWVFKAVVDYNKKYSKYSGLNIENTFRYGLSNQHFNAFTNVSYRFNTKNYSGIRFSSGKNVFQFNNANPIKANVNSISTLFYTRNYMKIYEAWFAQALWIKALGNGLTLQVNANFQHRLPLENTTDYMTSRFDNRNYSPNFPEELSSKNITEHKALSVSADLIWQPGARYIELPEQNINLGSKYPAFRFSFKYGVPDVLGSQVNYTRWGVSTTDNLNLKLLGKINYRLRAQGFIQASKVFEPDYIHVLANRTAIASDYLNSFQLLPYYLFSNTEKFTGEAFVEYHLNGLLTNKIPGFKKLNWFLVLAGNHLYINKDTYYNEASIGLENIFKILRVDFVKGWLKNDYTTGVRVAVPIL